MKIVLILIIGIYLFLYILEMFFSKRNCRFDIYFGVPGCGKTTFAAYLAKKRLKKKGKVYSNAAVKGCLKLDPTKDLGVFKIKDGLILIDEAGIEFDNRNFKTFSKSNKIAMKFHRHDRNDFAFFSQDMDVDLKIRKLATRQYLLKKSLIPFFIMRRTILRKVGINEMTREIQDEYYFQFILFGTKLIFSPRLWKMFDTHCEYEELPEKDWETW